MISRENTSDTSNRIIGDAPINNAAINNADTSNSVGDPAEAEDAANEPSLWGLKLITVSELFEAVFEKPSFGKRTRSQYYNIVHAFREAFPTDKNKSGTLITSDYQACDTVIQRMNSPEMSKLIAPPLLQKIEKLSTPDTYERVRRANRLRVHGQEPLSEDGLNRLSREIRAAMIWRQLSDTTE